MSAVAALLSVYLRASVAKCFSRGLVALQIERLIAFDEIEWPANRSIVDCYIS